MPDWIYLVAVALLLAVARPLFALLLAVLLWVGYKILPNSVGRALFGHYWKQERAHRRLQ